MATLTTAQRKKLPDSDFAIPSKRKYPIPDESHARNALARVAAYGTKSEKTQVYTAVRRRYPALWKRHDEYKGERVVLRKVESPRGRTYYHVRWHEKKEPTNA